MHNNETLYQRSGNGNDIYSILTQSRTPATAFYRTNSYKV